MFLPGVIKGSEEALTRDDACLSSSDYMQLNNKKRTSLATRRSDVYTIFEMYEKQKHAENRFDAADGYVAPHDTETAYAKPNY